MNRGLSWIALLPLVGLCSCILADPLPEEKTPPTRRPAIVHGSVSPPVSSVLLELPDEFIVPVDMTNPQASYEWRLFIDYDPATNAESSLVQSGTGAGTPTSPAQTFVSFTVDRDVWPGPCHRIELAVALHFVGLHEGDAAGFDSITWFYAPSGNFTSCGPQ